MMVVVLVLVLGAPMAFAGQPEGKGKGSSGSLDSEWSTDVFDSDAIDGSLIRCLEKSCRGAR
jgi:hypothetical protein